MEEETVASNEVTVVHATSSTEVNSGTKSDEEASLKMELEVEKETFSGEESFETAAEVKVAESANSVTEVSCAADESCVEEVMVLSKKKKKKLAAQEKMRVVELENAELKEQMSFAKERLNALEEDLANLLSENKELERSKEKRQDRCLREEELERLLEAAELRAKEQMSSELEMKKSVEASFRSQVLQLQEDLGVIAYKKELLEASVAEVTENFEQMRDRCIDLESEMKLSREEADSLISELEHKLKSVEQLDGQTTQKNLELQGLLRSTRLELEESESKLEELRGKLSEVELLLEGKCRNAETELAKHSDMVSGLTTQLQSAERINAELENQLTIFKSEHDGLMEETQTEREQMNSRVHGLSGKVFELESELKRVCAQHERQANATHERNLELQDLVQSCHSKIKDLEQDKDSLVWKCDESERQLAESLNVITEERRKSEEALHYTNSKLTTKVGELQQLLDCANARLLEAQEQLDDTTHKLASKEFEGKELDEQVFKLQEDLAVTQDKKELLEASVAELTEKFEQMRDGCIHLEHKLKSLEQESRLELEESESKLEEMNRQVHELREAESERNLELQHLVQSCHSKIEDLEREKDSLVQKCDQAEAASKEYADMVSALTTELENALELAAESVNVITEERRISEEALHDSLVAAQGKLESVENNLKEAGIREYEITNKLESAQLQLQHQGRVLEEATTKTKELESVNDMLMKDTELKFQQLMDKLNNKDSEVKSLYEKLQILEDQIKDSEDQNGLLADTNSTLTCKVSELQQILEEVSQQLASTMNTVVDDKCSNLEDQLKMHVYELSDKVHHQEKMNEALEAKLGQLEMHTGALTEANAKLDGELADSQSKLNDLQQKLSAALAEKDSALENFQTSFKAAEDLKKELSSERHTFQCIIASIMEEKQLLGEANTVAENGLQTLIAELDRQLKEYKESNGALIGELENLKLQVHGRVEELEQQILMNEAQFDKEIASMTEEKQLLSEANTVAQNELQTFITQLEYQLVEYKEGNEALHAELENTKFQAMHYSALQFRVKELEELLLATEAQFKKEVEIIEAAAAAREAEMSSMLEQSVQKLRDGEAFNDKVQCLEAEVLVFPPTPNTELKGENFKLEFVQESAEIYPLEPIIYKEKGDGPGEAKSLDINILTLKKKKMEKPGKSSKQQTPSPTTEVNAPSPLNNIKIAVGVGLVSIIASILAGKK